MTISLLKNSTSSGTPGLGLLGLLCFAMYTTLEHKKNTAKFYASLFTISLTKKKFIYNIQTKIYLDMLINHRLICFPNDVSLFHILNER